MIKYLTILRIKNYKFTMENSNCAYLFPMCTQCNHKMNRQCFPTGLIAFTSLACFRSFQTLNFFTFWQFDQNRSLYHCTLKYIVYFYYNSCDDMCSMFSVPHQLDNIFCNANAILTTLTLYYPTFGTPDWVH